MSLFVDLFGYFAIIIHGLAIAGQSVAVGSVLFLVCLARPLGWMAGATGGAVEDDTLRMIGWGALGGFLIHNASATTEVQARL